jgi:hypothetical protein
MERRNGYARSAESEGGGRPKNRKYTARRGIVKLHATVKGATDKLLISNVISPVVWAA